MCRYGPPIFWTRDDTAGLWHPDPTYPPGSAEPPAPPPPLNNHAGQPPPSAATPTPAPTPAPVPAPVPNGVAEDAAASALLGGETELEARLRSSLVMVDVDIPLVREEEHVHPRTLDTPWAHRGHALVTHWSHTGHTLVTHWSHTGHTLTCVCMCVRVRELQVALSDGVHARSFAGNGLVVYHGARLGLVLVDRNTVTVGPCDVNLSFGAHPAEISGKVCVGGGGRLIDVEAWYGIKPKALKP